MSASVSSVAHGSHRPVWRGWLHLVGAIVLPAASPILFLRAHTWSQVLWVLCYLLGVEAMLVTSSLYHRVRWSPRQREVMKRADLTAIFVAMMGTYLAIAGLTMHGTIRLVLLLVVAGGALLALAIRWLFRGSPRWALTLPYLAVGWAAVGFLPQIARGGGALCAWLVVGGGLAYTLGALAYGLRRPELWPRHFGYHELFHAATLVGVGLHFAAIAAALR